MTTSNVFFTEDECKALAVAAFEDTDEGHRRLQVGEQRIAAAIMAHHANMVTNAPKGVAITALSKACDPNEAMARATLQKAMVAFFMGKLTVASKTKADATAKRGVEQQRSMMIRNGLELASVLSLCNVDLSSFDQATGMWNIPLALLCKDGFEVEGSLKTTNLDRNGWVSRKLVIGGKTEYDSFMASVKRLKEIRKPKDGRAASTPDDGKPVTIRAAVAQVMLFLRATNLESGSKAPLIQVWGDVEEPDRRAIQTFRQWCDALDKATADRAANAKAAKASKAA